MDMFCLWTLLWHPYQGVNICPLEVSNLGKLILHMICQNLKLPSKTLTVKGHVLESAKPNVLVYGCNGANRIVHFQLVTRTKEAWGPCDKFGLHELEPHDFWNIDYCYQMKAFLIPWFICLPATQLAFLYPSLVSLSRMSAVLRSSRLHIDSCAARVLYYERWVSRITLQMLRDFIGQTVAFGGIFVRPGNFPRKTIFDIIINLQSKYAQRKAIV